MRTCLRPMAILVASAGLSLLGSCGSSGSALVAASPSLAGNWGISAVNQPTSTSQIGTLGGAVSVSSTGAISGTFHALPLHGVDASSLCYPMMSDIPVTGTLTADNTLTLTSSVFAGNTLTVHGTYVAGDNKTLPALKNASYAITGPCALAAQPADVTQEPLANGTYTGTATMYDNTIVTGDPYDQTPFTLPFTAVFSNATLPPAGTLNTKGMYTVDVTVTFDQDFCASSPASFQAQGFISGPNLSIGYRDPATGTVFGAPGYLTAFPTASGYSFGPVTISNSDPAYIKCNYRGTATMTQQAPS